MHCDTISAITRSNETLLDNQRHFDLRRAKNAGISLQVFALFSSSRETDNSLKEITLQMDKFYQELEQNSEQLFQILNSAGLERVGETERIACLLHLEGAEAIGNDIGVYRQLCNRGLRSIGLTWNNSNQLAGGIMDKDASGLTKWGRKVLREMERDGIILDLAHISEKSFFEALDCYTKPVMVTHANAQTICDHPRNLNDKQLQTLAENGGIIGLNQVAGFVKKEQATLEDFLDHAVYISELIGVKHLAMGSDFDGADNLVLPGIEAYACLEESLYSRGFSPREVKMILQENALRVMGEVLHDL